MKTLPHSGEWEQGILERGKCLVERIRDDKYYKGFVVRQVSLNSRQRSHIAKAIDYAIDAKLAEINGRYESVIRLYAKSMKHFKKSRLPNTTPGSKKQFEERIDEAKKDLRGGCLTSAIEDYEKAFKEQEMQTYSICDAMDEFERRYGLEKAQEFFNESRFYTGLRKHRDDHPFLYPREP